MRSPQIPGSTAEQILALAPEVLVMDAKPGDLTSSALVAQLKTRPETESSLKIVMIVHGGAYDRASGLNLGADDVISFPFEAVEFAARIRTQFRTRQPEEELKTMLKYAVQREQLTDLAVETLKEPGAEAIFQIDVRDLGVVHRGGCHGGVSQFLSARDPQGNAPIKLRNCASAKRIARGGRRKSSGCADPKRE